MYGVPARRTPLETANYLTSCWQYYEEFHRKHQRDGMVAFIARIAPLAIAEKINVNNRHWYWGLYKHDGRAVTLICGKMESLFRSLRMKILAQSRPRASSASITLPGNGS